MNIIQVKFKIGHTVHTKFIRLVPFLDSPLLTVSQRLLTFKYKCGIILNRKTHSKNAEKEQNGKILQPGLIEPVPLTVPVSASYRPRPQHRLKQNSTFKDDD